MRLLKLRFEGAPLFRDDAFDIDFYAVDRVTGGGGDGPLNDVHRVDQSNSVYSQNIIGITGVNASGKTTVLNLLRFTLGYLSQGYTMRGFRGDCIRLGKVGERLKVSAAFWHDGGYYLLESTLRRASCATGTMAFGSQESSQSLSFVDEVLWRYDKPRITRRDIKDLAVFKSHAKVVKRRNGTADPGIELTESERTYLGDDRSIVSALTGKVNVATDDPDRALAATTMPTPVIQAFDGSVEKLEWDQEAQVFHLKFKGEPERIVNHEVAMGMLSRGTVFGAELVRHAIDVLQSGGYLIVDEIEESLNRSLVATVLDLFASPVTNPHGAQLVFSTHYPEILDRVHRKDNVYLLLRGEDCRTRALKYSDRIKRIENKKSDVIISNLIAGSMPSYPDVQAMREYVRSQVNG